MIREPLKPCPKCRRTNWNVWIDRRTKLLHWRVECRCGIRVGNEKVAVDVFLPSSAAIGAQAHSCVRWLE